MMDECYGKINNNEGIEIFKKRLKHLYKQIDSISSLLWSHENHITGKRLRSENDEEDNKLTWMNKETTQTGYGEIAKVTYLITLGLYVKPIQSFPKHLDPN
jgi:hypothetical protein